MPASLLYPAVRAERAIEQWTRRFGVATLQISLGVVYIWFGVLKILDIDPTRGVQRVAFYDFKLDQVLPILGTWEVLIGIALLLPILALPRKLENGVIRAAIWLLFIQVCTTIVLALAYPDRLFVPAIPHVSVMGEYLVRNFVFAVAGLVIAGHLREQEESPHAVS